MDQNQLLNHEEVHPPVLDAIKKVFDCKNFVDDAKTKFYNESICLSLLLKS